MDKLVVMHTLDKFRESRSDRSSGVLWDGNQVTRKSLPYMFI